ncbi:MAG: phosphatidate cytidylyltransferase [Planctomycetia bacterium]|nr:phosphatidate cytidylyltransferase [Planctomycetia bacterium]
MSIKANRSIVSTLGIPGILFFIWLGGVGFALFTLAVMLLALFEYYQIAKLKKTHPIIWIGLFVSILVAYFYYNQPKIDGIYIYAIIVILIISVLFTELFRKKPNPTENYNITVGGILYIPLLVGALIGIRNFDTINETHFTFALFISIWICDSAAYIAGKKFGKKKIYPRVSPNKTVVGSVAGLIFSFITYIVMNKIGLFNLDITQITILSVISGVFGQTGDFVESLFKRDANVKDSGILLLGHGGVLDRFDSLIIASPLVYIFLNVFY